MIYIVIIAILGFVSIFAFAYIIKLHLAIDKVNRDINHDSLTNALNRQGFISYAEKIIKGSNSKKKYCILFFNIKGFKVINELFGVNAGDKVLCQSV